MEVARALPVPVTAASRSSSSLSRYASTQGSFRVHSRRGPPPLRLSRPSAASRATYCGGARLSEFTVLHKGRPRGTGRNQMFCRFQSPALWTLAGVLSSGAPGAAWACRHLRLYPQRRCGGRLLGHSGLRFNFEYDYINQGPVCAPAPARQLRHSHQQPSNPDSAGGEIEKADDQPLSHDGDELQSQFRVEHRCPRSVRDAHAYHLRPAADPHTPPPKRRRTRSAVPVSPTWATSRSSVAIRGCCRPTNLGVQLGVKLPTGHYGTAVNFNSGPNVGTPLDASLQAGTGSTDLIVGAYYYRR